MSILKYSESSPWTDGVLNQKFNFFVNYTFFKPLECAATIFMAINDHLNVYEHFAVRRIDGDCAYTELLLQILGRFESNIKIYFSFLSKYQEMSVFLTVCLQRGIVCHSDN